MLTWLLAFARPVKLRRIHKDRDQTYLHIIIRYTLGGIIKRDEIATRIDTDLNRFSRYQWIETAMNQIDRNCLDPNLLTDFIIDPLFEPDLLSTERDIFEMHKFQTSFPPFFFFFIILRFNASFHFEIENDIITHHRNTYVI